MKTVRLSKSGEVHDLDGIRMHLDGAEHRARGARMAVRRVARLRGLSTRRALRPGRRRGRPADRRRLLPGRGRRRSACAHLVVVRARARVAPLARVVLLLHQVVARAERHQVRVVRRRRNRHRTRAPHVRVAQLVRQLLQLVRCHAVVVPQNVVVRRTASTLETHAGREDTYSDKHCSI